MVEGSKLGRLEKVELRECWKNEALDFTPWLAKEENISLLSGVLGVELEVKQTEVSVGPFSADIVCRDTADNSLVLIENQLERTDHGHLGQILTYAAGLDAVTIVWVAKRFTDEHRAALDWFNEKSEEGLNVFGLEIELWRIGDSLPAPKFNIVSKPNDWLKFVKARTKTHKNLSSFEQNWFDYWQSFGRFLEVEGSRFKAPPPRVVNWASWGLGVADVGLSAVVRFGKNKGAEIQIDLSGPEAKQRFGVLAAEKKAIEQELPFTLDWQERPDIQGSRIVVTSEIDMNDRTVWAEIHRWMLEKMSAMEDTFRPRVVAFKIPPGSDDSESDNS